MNHGGLERVAAAAAAAALSNEDSGQ